MVKGNEPEPEPDKGDEEWEKKEEQEEQEEPGEPEKDPVRIEPEFNVPPRVVRALTRRYIPTPANVGGSPKTPAEILSQREPEPPANDRDAHLKWQARDQLRFFGRELRKFGLPKAMSASATRVPPQGSGGNRLPSNGGSPRSP